MRVCRMKKWWIFWHSKNHKIIQFLLIRCVRSLRFLHFLIPAITCLFIWMKRFHSFFVYFSFCESVTKNARNNDTTNLMLIITIGYDEIIKKLCQKKQIKMLNWWFSVLCLQRISHDLYFVNEWLKIINCCYGWQYFKCFELATMKSQSMNSITWSEINQFFPALTL